MKKKNQNRHVAVLLLLWTVAATSEVVGFSPSLVGIRNNMAKSSMVRRFVFHDYKNTETLEDSMSADELEPARRQMMAVLKMEELQLQALGRKVDPIPDFRAEVLEEEGHELPVGVDRRWAEKHLRLGYEKAVLTPILLEMANKHMDVQEPEPRDLMKRLGTDDPDKLEWYFGERQVGDIYQQRRSRPDSYNRIRRSFSHQAYRKEKMLRGSTHVAAGFLDLGMLFAANLVGPRNETLHFLGVDNNPYTVAKTLVVWEMLKQTPQNVPESEQQQHHRFVAQAWFSATWSHGTEAAVKRALASLCTSPPNDVHPVVFKILGHWDKAASVPLKEARAQWAWGTTRHSCKVAHMLRKQDRLALADYELSGDFSLDGLPICGNILMFDCPDGTPPRMTDETVFSAMPWSSLVEILLQENSADKTILDAAGEHALNGIRKLALWASSSEVTVDLICANVSDVVDRIADSKPKTMSWFNLADHMDYGEFHNLARRCSIHGDTVHYGHSMNWVTEVFGTALLDYSNKKSRCELIETANSNAAYAFRTLEWDRFLRVPPPESPSTNVALYGSLVLSLYKVWGSYFFDIASNQGPFFVASLDPCFDTNAPFSLTGSQSVFYTFSYDPSSSKAFDT